MMRALHLNETLPALGSGSPTLLPPSAASDKCSYFKYITISIRPVWLCGLRAANSPRRRVGAYATDNPAGLAAACLQRIAEGKRWLSGRRDERQGSGRKFKLWGGASGKLPAVSGWCHRLAGSEKGASGVCSSWPHDGRKWNYFPFL